MNKTKIEWVKNPGYTGIPQRDAKGRFQYQGYTWNPITGCLNHNNGLCKGGGFPCYAYKLANGRLRQRYLANENTIPCHPAMRIRYEDDIALSSDDPFFPRLWPERLKELVPIGGLVCELVYPPKARKGIFVCDMSDLFGIGIPEEWTLAVLNLIKKWPAHRFYLLTKQPQNLIKFSPFPENCRVGVTATGLQMFNKAMFNLQQIEAKVKYISFEPLLEEIKMSSSWLTLLGKPIIDWIIIGAQTNPYKPPKIEWVEEIVRAADKAGIPVFLKDNLDKLMPKYNPSEKLRQEVPG